VLAVPSFHRQSVQQEIPVRVNAVTDRHQFFLRRYSGDYWE
jgi:hypothetical protein